MGTRARDRARALAFCELLGFKTHSDTGFEKGHPVIMEHPSGVVINILGPSDQPDGPNALAVPPRRLGPCQRPPFW